MRTYVCWPLFLALIFQMLPANAHAQTTIQNAELGMQDFYASLQNMRNGTLEQVDVYHCGDSHIQADYLTGTIRNRLQGVFGNAGRGLVAPLRAARTNEAPGYRTGIFSGNIQVARLTNTYPEAVLGASGYTFFSYRSLAYSIAARENAYGIGPFNKVAVLDNAASAGYQLLLSDTAELSLEGKWDAGTGKLRFMHFDTPLRALRIGYRPIAPEGTLEHYGLLLENDSCGIIYHAVGVNGATYAQYLKAELLLPQLQAIAPKLIIISLGTNECVGPIFDAGTFYQQANRLVSNLREALPGCSILLCAPPDYSRRISSVYYTGRGRRKRKHVQSHYVPNGNVEICGRTLRQVAMHNDAAYFDLQEAMGGPGAMQRYFANGWAAYDHIHFSERGYQLQGDLLFNAIMNGYKHFVGAGLD